MRPPGCACCHRCCRCGCGNATAAGRSSPGRAEGRRAQPRARVRDLFVSGVQGVEGPIATTSDTRGPRMLAVNSQAAADRRQRTRVPPRSDRGLTAHRPALLALAVAAALMSIVVLPAQAQAQTPAAAGAIYELPAQPLDHALAQLARQAGLQLLANNEL